MITHKSTVSMAGKMQATSPAQWYGRSAGCPDTPDQLKQAAALVRKSARTKIHLGPDAGSKRRAATVARLREKLEKKRAAAKAAKERKPSPEH